MTNLQSRKPLSFFDQHSYTFKCERPECGKVFKQILRSLVYAKEVVCPKCGAVMDIREAKRHGDVGKALDTASELDKQARQKQ